MTRSLTKKPILPQILYTLSLVFLGTGLLTLGWAVWPPAMDAVQLSIPEGRLPGAPLGADYVSLQSYDLTVTWPSRIRRGESGLLSVTLTGTDDNVGDNMADAQIVLIEPFLPGFALQPEGNLQTSLQAGQDLTYSWSISKGQPGDHSGKVLTSFGFYEDELLEIVAVPVAATDVSIQVTSLWGLSAQVALWVGFVGLAFWGGLFLLGRMAEGRAG